MDSLEQLFKLIQPSQPPGINSVSTEQEKVDEWFSSLNRIDAEGTVKQICFFLEQTNRLIIENDERLYIIEKSHETIISIVGQLKKKYLDGMLPLTEEKQQLVAACIKVYQLMINAQLIVLQSHIKTEKKSKRKCLKN